MVIVRDMWLTGFDAPCLNTMYINEPMKDHNLMQAIARVNRIFKYKPGGLIASYIGIATNLKKAFGFYSENGGKGIPAETNDTAVSVLGDEQLRAFAREIADKVRKNATIDFAIKEIARARIMVVVRHVLNKYGYPPDKQLAAIELIMKQAENLADVYNTISKKQGGAYERGTFKNTEG